MQSSAGQHRLSRRPFGPRLQHDEQDDQANGPDSSLSPRTLRKIGSVRWNTSQENVNQPQARSDPPRSYASRPLPPKPRNFFSDARKRPLPPAHVSDGQDIPFSFSSRSSRYADVVVDALDPLKDPFATPTGIPSDAPIWKSYMEEAQHQDKDIIANWNQMMDVILIFAGLFSAILTAFVIEFYKPLQPDLQEISAVQLAGITELLEAIYLGRNITNDVLPSTSIPRFTPSVAVVGVNILWFVSLTCSLGAAIGAMVIKQWLQFYTMNLSPNAYEYAHQHQYRHSALYAWHVPSIISAMPFIMLLSVGLFLVGLALQLLQLHIGVAAVSIGSMTIVLTCYGFSLIVSMVYPDCPYKTPAMALLQSLWSHVRSVWHGLLLRKEVSSSNQSLPLALTEVKEISEIREKQAQILVDGVTWLLSVSQQERAIHHALLSISSFPHTDNMVEKLLACNALEQLVQRATVPLPPLGHDFWYSLHRLTPSHPIFIKSAQSLRYMETLLFVWHHPSYLASNRPPTISEQQTSEGSNKAHYRCLLGDWLLFWRMLKQEHGQSFHSLAQKGFDLNLYAYVICTEVLHYHLQGNLTPLYLPQNRGAFIDLHEMLQAVREVGQERLGLEDVSIWLLLDTLAYVFSGIDTAPLELQGLPRTWFSPSQSPSLMRKETVLLLLQLLDLNNMQFNLTSKKLLLCLQMLLPVPMISASRRNFFLHYLQHSPSRMELFEHMSTALEAVVKVFVPRHATAVVNEHASAATTGSSMPEKQSIYGEIAALALRLLYNSVLSDTDVPNTNHDHVFLELPPLYADDLLQHIQITSAQVWKSPMKVSWVYDLLTKWHASGNLMPPHVERCAKIFEAGLGLAPGWSDGERSALLKKVLDFLGLLWKNPDPFYGNLVCLALCDILDGSFTRDRNKKILYQFIEMQALVAVGVFLVSEESSEECRRRWLNLTLRWQSEFGEYTPSAQEVYQFEGLRNATTH